MDPLVFFCADADFFLHNNTCDFIHSMEIHCVVLGLREIIKQLQYLKMSRNFTIGKMYSLWCMLCLYYEIVFIIVNGLNTRYVTVLNLKGESFFI